MIIPKILNLEKYKITITSNKPSSKAIEKFNKELTKISYGCLNKHDTVIYNKVV